MVTILRTLNYVRRNHCTKSEWKFDHVEMASHLICLNQTPFAKRLLVLARTESYLSRCSMLILFTSEYFVVYFVFSA